MNKVERKAIIKKTVEHAGTMSCVYCEQPSSAVLSFTPEDTEAFGMTEDEALYCPLCEDCARQ